MLQRHTTSHALFVSSRWPSTEIAAIEQHFVRHRCYADVYKRISAGVHCNCNQFTWRIIQVKEQQMRYFFCFLMKSRDGNQRHVSKYWHQQNESGITMIAASDQRPCGVFGPSGMSTVHGMSACMPAFLYVVMCGRISFDGLTPHPLDVVRESSSGLELREVKRVRFDLRLLKGRVYACSEH